MKTIVTKEKEITGLDTIFDRQIEAIAKAQAQKRRVLSPGLVRFLNAQRKQQTTEQGKPSTFWALYSLAMQAGLKSQLLAFLQEKLTNLSKDEKNVFLEEVEDNTEVRSFLVQALELAGKALITGRTKDIRTKLLLSIQKPSEF